MKTTNYRFIVSGNTVEVFSFELPISYDFKVPTKKGGRYFEDERDQLKHKEETRKRSMQRTRARFQRIIYSNAEQWVQPSGLPYPLSFLSFTFEENLKDPTTANKIFSRFVKRLNFNIYKSKESVLKYVSVMEFQKRGAVHYHCIFFNLPQRLIEFELKDRRIANVWGHGFIDAKVSTDVDRAVHYLTKYMKKGFDDPRLDGKKRYFGSRGLLRPIEIKDEEMARKLLAKLSSEEKVYENEFKSEHQGVTKYQKFRITPEHFIRLNIDAIKNSIWF